jgi:hypothetical protein
MATLARALAMSLGLAVALSAGACSQVQGVLATPFLGAVEDCGPHIDADLCRRIGEEAIRSIKGPAVSSESVTVSQWDACTNEQVVAVAPGAAQGKVCYSVMGSGYAGGERVAPGTYRNGTPVEIDAVVWSDKDGGLHAAVKATPVDITQP